MRISDWSSDVALPIFRQLDIPEVSDFDSPTGKGAVGTVGGKRIFLGAGAYLNENGIDVSTAAAQADGMRADGATAVFAAVDGRVAGILAIADPIKATTAEALAALRKEGISVVMLTGDNRTTAQAVARKLGIDVVEAEVLPDRSEEHTSELQSLMRIS